MKIGVFDSGVGGKSVANAVEKAFPEHTVLYAEDGANVPYGTKSPKELSTLVIPILEKLLADGCEIIVIACNTVTTTIISELRQKLKVPLVGIEPMVKPAAQLTKTKIIAVCATPTTLNSPRYAKLVEEFAPHLEIIEPDCSDWSYMIEHNQIDQSRIGDQITEICRKGADVIVLACTHYHWIEEEIVRIASGYKVEVLQPEQAIIKRLKQLTEQQS